jgi:transcriptional regulator with XRE-family HTH domain
MTKQKQALIRALTRARIAKTAGMDPGRLSKIMSGKGYVSVDAAHRLSDIANQLCADFDLPAPFEANDFKPDLNNNHRELPLDAVFIVADSLWSEDAEVTAKKLLKRYEQEPEVEQQLRELYLTADLDQTITLYDGKTIRIKETN